MIIEQTKEYAKRMEYDPKTKTFQETEYESLMHRRNFVYPYGWIKESGTPPEPHCDCILMSDGDFQLGEEVAVEIIGMFKRKDGDHKYIVVEARSAKKGITTLSADRIATLKALYPYVGEGEGWFGREEALKCYRTCERVL